MAKHRVEVHVKKAGESDFSHDADVDTYEHDDEDVAHAQAAARAAVYEAVGHKAEVRPAHSRKSE